jgi:GntR family transcriptional regulator, arabinose operon transcriptional repressor
MTEDNRPLYVRIIEEYKAKILEGELKENERLPSEMEVANDYGVSRITSKRAFEELERDGFIYRVKGSGSYVAVRKEKKGKTVSFSNAMKVIDIVIPFDSSQGRSIDMIRGINDYLQENGYFLKILNTIQDVNKERELLSSLYNTGASGIIYYPISGRNNSDILQILSLNNFPVITVDKYFEGLPIDYVISDNLSGSYNAISYLINKGHENIGYISEIALETATSVRDRFYGYCKALKDNGLEIKYDNYVVNYIDDIRINHPELLESFTIKSSPFNKKCMEYMKRILNGFLDRQDKITAIHTVNDYVAMHILKTALDMGVKVPDELSIVGFDNIEISQHLEVPLTTVEQDFYQVGYKAAMVLIDRISSGLSKQEKIIIPTKLIERESVIDRNLMVQEFTA